MFLWELTGKTALCRGPLVYCFEGADNEGDVLSLSVKDHVPPTVGGYDENLLGGSVALNVAACRTDASQGLYTSVKPGQTECRAVRSLLYLGKPETEPDAGMDSGECLKHSMFRVDFRFRRGEVRKIVKISSNKV